MRRAGQAMIRDPFEDIELSTAAAPDGLGQCASHHLPASDMRTRVRLAAGCAEQTASADEIVCRCLGISKAAITSAIENGQLESLREVIESTGAGGGCTACHIAIRAYFHQRP